MLACVCLNRYYNCTQIRGFKKKKNKIQTDGTVGLAVDEHLQAVAGGVDGQLRPLSGLQELLVGVDVHAALKHPEVSTQRSTI